MLVHLANFFTVSFQSKVTWNTPSLAKNSQQYIKINSTRYIRLWKANDST